MSVDQNKLRIQVESGIRRSADESGIRPTGVEVKNFVDKQLAVHKMVADGLLNEGAAPVPVAGANTHPASPTPHVPDGLKGNVGTVHAHGGLAKS